MKITPSWMTPMCQRTGGLLPLVNIKMSLMLIVGITIIAQQYTWIRPAGIASSMSENNIIGSVLFKIFRKSVSFSSTTLNLNQYSTLVPNFKI